MPDDTKLTQNEDSAGNNGRRWVLWAYKGLRFSTGPRVEGKVEVMPVAEHEARLANDPARALYCQKCWAEIQAPESPDGGGQHGLA